MRAFVHRNAVVLIVHFGVLDEDVSGRGDIEAVGVVTQSVLKIGLDLFSRLVSG